MKTRPGTAVSTIHLCGLIFVEKENGAASTGILCHLYSLSGIFVSIMKDGIDFAHASFEPKRFIAC